MMDAKILKASEVEAIENSAIRTSWHVVGILARRWHPGTSLTSWHVVGTKRIFHKRQKTTFFQKKQRKKFCS